MRRFLSRVLTLFLYALIVFSFTLGVVSPVFSQEGGVAEGETEATNPKSREATVTASVPVFVSPPTPVLMLPENSAMLTSGVVTFRWRMPVHDVPLSRFELLLNGTVKFPAIHAVDQDTDDYTLRVADKDEDEFTLTLRQDKWLADGVYTWKIRVIDANDRGTNSATWSFTIDSTPPPLLITQVDQQETSISATDPSTQPSDPIIVTTSDPVIYGHTESGSELQAIVMQGESILATYKISIPEGGLFSLQLLDLPADQEVRVKFTVIDPANNTTVYDGLPLKYQPKRVIIKIPGLLPITLTINIRFPFFRLRPPQPSPPPAPSEIPTLPGGRPVPVPTPTEQVYAKPLVAREWLYGGMIIGIGWYVLALFWLTGNSWGSFLTFFGRLLHTWTWLQTALSSIVITDRAEFPPLPLLALGVEQLTPEKKWKKYWLVSDVYGRWSLPWTEGSFGRITIGSKRYAWRTTVEDLKVTDKNEFLYHGQDLLLRRGEQNLQVTPKAVVIDFSIIWLTGVTHETTRLAPSWGVWLPRCGLFLAGLSSLALCFLVPVMLSFVVALVVLLIILRDFQLQLAKRLAVYV